MENATQKITFSTKEAAIMLGLRIAALNRSIYEDRLTPPEKNLSNSYRWTFQDIERASWVLRKKSADDVLEGCS